MRKLNRNNRRYQIIIFLCTRTDKWDAWGQISADQTPSTAFNSNHSY